MPEKTDDDDEIVASVIVPDVHLHVPGAPDPTEVVDRGSEAEDPAVHTTVFHGRVQDVEVLGDANIEGVEDLVDKEVSENIFFEGLDEEDLKILVEHGEFRLVIGEKITDDVSRGLYIPMDEVPARIGGFSAISLEKGRPYGVYVFVGLAKPTAQIEVLGQGKFLKIPALAFGSLSEAAQRKLKLRVLGNGHQIVLNRKLALRERVLNFPNVLHEVPQELADLMMSPENMHSDKTFSADELIKHEGGGKLAFVMDGTVSIRHPGGVGHQTEVAVLQPGNFLGERAAAGFAQQAKMYAGENGARILWCNLTPELLDAALIHQAKKLSASNDAVL